jgi:basic membrane protein A and related proteins
MKRPKLTSFAAPKGRVSTFGRPDGTDMSSSFRLLPRRKALLLLASLPAALLITPAMAAGETKVALIMTGSINDGGWNQLAYQGLQKVAKTAGYKVAYVENVSQARIGQVVRGYADDGYDLVIGHGYEFGGAFLEIAPEFGKVKFFASTFKPQPAVPANVEYADLAYYDLGYAAGALAALSSTQGKSVGFVGGGDNPTQRRWMQTFMAGAKAMAPGIEPVGVVTGDYDNAAKGRETAQTMTGNGADVIFHAANVTGLGAIQGATASGAKVIGCYTDQTELSPKLMVTSFRIKLDDMVVRMAAQVKDGKFAGGTEWKPAIQEIWEPLYGGKEGRNPALLDDAKWAKFKQVWSDIGSGKIDVAGVK